MHHFQVQWKIVQASLVITCLFIDSLSKTTREQEQNACSPNRSDFKLGKSIHHFILSESLFNSNEALKKQLGTLPTLPISITFK